MAKAALVRFVFAAAALGTVTISPSARALDQVTFGADWRAEA